MSILKISMKKKEDLVTIISRVPEPEFGDNPPYLQKYIKEVAKSLGQPLIVDRLSGDMKRWRTYNVIYPVGLGIFIHTCSVARSSGYNSYNVIEPPRPPPELMKLLEEQLAIQISSDFVPRSSEEKKKYLLYLLDKILLPDDKVDYKNIKLKKGKIPVKPEDINYIKYHVIRDKVGVGVLEPFLRDPYLEDISCSGLGNIFVIHKMFGPLESNVGFADEEELNNFIIKLGEKIGKPISAARPVVDATLPDGSRINIVYGSDVSLRGSNFTIRRVAKSPISVTQLIDWGTFDARIAAYVWMMLNEGMSMFICGETASGKTTSLNAIAVFIKPTAKIVSIEDTAEVVLPHPNWTRELTRDTGSPESSVTMFDLLRAALRQRPNYIIVGEIRGAEGNIAFQAMQSVAWETPVAIKRGNIVEVTPIGEFVDEIIGENTENGSKFINDSRLKTLTLIRDGRLAWRPIKAVYKHKASKTKIIVDDEEGIIRVTESHSIFIFDTTDYLVKPALVSNIKINDYIVKPMRKHDGFIGNRVFKEKVFFKIDDKPSINKWRRLLNGEKNQTKKIPIKIVIDLYREAGVELPKWLDYAYKRCKNGEQRYLEADTSTRSIEYLLRLNIPETIKLKALRLKKLIESDIEIRTVKKILDNEEAEYVYDLSVPDTELFIGGSNPIALHNTGHPVLSTFHAANLERLIQRLTNPPINIPKTNIDSLNLAWFQSAVYVRGFPSRRVIEIDEIIGYDSANNAIAAMPVFTWDPVTDKFLFAGKGSSYLLEEKLAVMRGLPKSKINEIYDELEMRKEYIQLLVDKKIFEYDRVFRAVIYAGQVGIEKALRDLKSGSFTP